jgi:pyridoxal phosphate enzyme (YggS family)
MTSAIPGHLSIARNLDSVRGRLQAACDRAGRDPAGVRLIGVTKTVPVDGVLDAVRAGLQDIGENYVQEATAKKIALGRAEAVRWHLIGNLQTNKAGAALEVFDIIHAVDSVRLAEALSHRSSRAFPVFLEVNVAEEGSKSGFRPDDVTAAVATVSKLPNLSLRGLMTVAPAVFDPEDVRPVFRTLRRLAEANGLTELSMGMTGDFEVAIEEGATMVRIGRAIFGERP